MLLAASGSAIPAVAEVVTEFATKSGTLVLTADDMADASPQFGPDGPGLAFQLQPEASETFADLTEASVGQTMSLRVCGDLLIEAMVRGRLAGAGLLEDTLQIDNACCLPC